MSLQEVLEDREGFYGSGRRGTGNTDETSLDWFTWCVGMAEPNDVP